MMSENVMQSVFDRLFDRHKRRDHHAKRIGASERHEGHEHALHVARESLRDEAYAILQELTDATDAEVELAESIFRRFGVYPHAQHDDGCYDPHGLDRRDDA
jgi:uncharacterized protein YdcH (DUF465 family)